MKFRNEEFTDTKIITGEAQEVQKQFKELAEQVTIIDVQYGYVQDVDGMEFHSLLILYREAK